MTLATPGNRPDLDQAKRPVSALSFRTDWESYENQLESIEETRVQDLQLAIMSKSWSKPTRYFVLTLVLIGVIWLVNEANDLIGPLAISALLAYVLNPAVTFVNTRTKLKRNVVVILVYLISLTILVGVAVTFAPIIPEQVMGLLEELQVILRQVEELLATPLILLGFRIPVDDIVAATPGLTTGFVRPDVIVEMLRAATTNLVWILVIIVTTYYLLQDWDRLREWLIQLAPDAYLSDARRLYEEVKGVLQRYLRGQLSLMIIIGILTGLGSAAIGLPGAAAFGLLAGLLDIILSVGPTIVMIIAALVALFVGSTYLPISNFWFMVVVIALYGLIQMIENVWLRPRIMGQTLRLHPAVVFVAVVGSLALAGVLTALIIVPVLSSAAVLGRYIYLKILDMDPWPEEEEAAG
jgi:predicted PurR-regulated permease PerM